MGHTEEYAPVCCSGEIMSSIGVSQTTTHSPNDGIAWVYVTVLFECQTCYKKRAVTRSFRGYRTRPVEQHPT